MARSKILVITALILAPALAVGESAYYSPPTRNEHPDKVLWGDTHLHTSLSVDSSGRGNETLTIDKAYRFARGEAVRTNNGETFKLSRPLDFLVVADHAVNMGVIPRLQARDPILLDTPVGRKWREIWDRGGWAVGEALKADSFEEWQAAVKRLDIPSGQPESFFWEAWNDDYVDDERFRRSVWEEVCSAADRYNEPDKFTAFIGYEWTPAGSHPKASNLHRNVIFRDDRSRACQVLPFSTQDSANVEELWNYMANYESTTGGQVLAIPHNGNRTGGLMFAPKNYDGKPLDLNYLRTRQRWEPLLEVTQIKGDSETHPLLSPTDEFADFETWPPFYTNTAEKAQYEYARSALKLGLDYQATMGVNPFKFGMVGSTDSHTGVSAVAENNFTGNYPLIEPSPYRARGAWWFSASGLAAVWARENTRDAIFAAMKRRETFATSGTRMTVRFFGGWHFTEQDINRPDYVDVGYARGVPMGADLSAAPKGAAPTFMIQAARDPQAANLDRIQVIKGWRDKAGETHEKIFDVALSDGRQPDANGNIPPVGSTVDIEQASYQNNIGDPELAVVWQDPQFDPKELAFYYVRVLEIPTPRWTTYDAAFYGNDIDSIPPRAPRIIQERAYTSPIWYSP